MIWYRVSVPQHHRTMASKGVPFVCGLEVNEAGQVVTAAPIMRWAIGLDIEVVTVWVRRREGSIEPLEVVAL